MSGDGHTHSRHGSGASEASRTGVAIALLRHFPTDWNGERRLQGQTDRPLTEEARARLGGLALPPPWDDAALVASPLSRAAETAALLAPGRRFRLEPRLVEISWGDWEGVTADALGQDAEGLRPVDRLGWRGRPPGGESAADAWARASAALRRLARSGTPAVLVTHKALMRVILGQAWGWQGPDRGSVDIRRAQLYPLRLDADGRPHSPAEPVRLVPRIAGGVA
ncbi:MAG: histidine phosphatase family protein [Pseudomonadota bacterium]